VLNTFIKNLSADDDADKNEKIYSKKTRFLTRSFQANKQIKKKKFSARN
jgi:hypothetical protein